MMLGCEGLIIFLKVILGDFEHCLDVRHNWAISF